MNNLKLNSGTSFISVDDLTLDEYNAIFQQAKEIKSKQGKGYRNQFRDTMARMMFWEPSTRTSGSFDTALELLGSMHTNFNISASSVAKGESLDDTAQMISQSADIMIARHSDMGTCRKIQADTGVPIMINAGEGTGEHPTQALLDMFTIKDKLGNKTPKIGLLGDLKHGRTAHSLIKLGSKMGADFTCVAPRKELEMPQEYLDIAKNNGSKVGATDSLDEVIGDLDVLYVTRLQKERGAAQDKIDAPEGGSGYAVTQNELNKMKPTALLMHPLPRVDEISTECDKDHRATYFEQAENGIWTRMALMMHLKVKHEQQLAI